MPVLRRRRQPLPHHHDPVRCPVPWRKPLVSASLPPDAAARNQRQLIFWRLLAAAGARTEDAANLDAVHGQLLDDLGLPAAVTDPEMSIDTLLQRFPELKPDFDGLQSRLAPPDEGQEPAPAEESF